MLISMALSTLLLLGLTVAAAGAPLALEDTTTVADHSVPRGERVEITLPALPARAGKITVLSFRAIIASAGPGGCNYNLILAINGQPTSRFTSAGTERMIARSASLELKAGGLGFPIFSGEKLMVLFAKDADEGDSMTHDGLGATFNLDVTDLVRGVDGNTLTFQNIMPGQPAPGFGHLPLTNLTVGYLDQSKLPKLPSLAPSRGKIAARIQQGPFEIRQATGGGFSLSVGGEEMLVETAVGMQTASPAALVAEDATPSGPVKLSPQPAASPGIVADWPGLRLERRLEVQGGLLLWHDRWTNTGAAPRGLPFRYRFFLRDKPARFWVGGSQDNSALVSSASNPTLFIHGAKEGNGFGITAENDVLRLVGGWRGANDLGEVYSHWLCLQPGKSIELELSITPVTDQGGYWSFINALRQRWGVNHTTMPAPMFWGFSRAAGETAEEKVKRALGHLGPIIVCIGPWQRLEPDARVVRENRYPKLPPDAPRAPGLTPDLDVEAFLTLQHREPYWQEVKKLTALIHEQAPEAKVIQMIHPSMETVYKPLQDRWPIAPDAIKTPDGSTFEAANYSRSWLHGMTAKDWGVLYYSPHDGGPQLQALLNGVRRGMDECNLDGIYSDEFSWAFARGYSRYDYGRQDGFSADLDDKGDIIRQKCDNAAVSEPSQLQITAEVLKRGKFFLGNGGNVLASTFRLPIHRFIEGGNGPSQMSQGHLSAVPLVLGNFGDEKTVKGVLEAVKRCLERGCLYSPLAVNLLLEGADNFVCKQYPITIERLGPGTVMGKERLITMATGSYDWPAGGGRLKLYRYNAEGTRIDAEAEVSVARGEPLSIMVPAGGLVIAEKQ